VTKLWETGIALARTAIEEEKTSTTSSTRRPTFVIASSGCYGAALSNGAEYTGDYGHLTDHNNADNMAEVQRLQDFHRKKLNASASADLTAIETVPSLLECQALAQLLLQEDCQCYISLACRDGSHLNDGTDLADALQVFRQVPNHRLVAFGLNCCDVQYLPSLVTIVLNELKLQDFRRGIVLYPNSGETWDSANATWGRRRPRDGTDDDEDDDAIWVETLMDCIRQIEASSCWYGQQQRPTPGILVGGCCRTTPATIALLRRRVQEHLLLSNDGKAAQNEEE
jgi:homocysteine S-methyltransferase